MKTLWFMCLFITQAALAAVVPGDTLGTPQLQRDTMSQLLFLDQAFAADCKKRKVVNTEIIEPLQDGRVSGGKAVGGRWKERWSLDRCGAIVPYEVSYTSDGKGGTYIGLGIPKDPADNAAAAPSGVNAELLASAESGDTDRVRELIDGGADLETRDQHGRTPLMVAAVKGHAPTLELLLEKGSDFATRNKYGATALQFAAGNGRTDAVEVLLAHGADANEKSGQLEEPPILSAASSGSIETVEALLKHGADVNGRSKMGGTALMRAAMNGQSEMTLFLLGAGADAAATNNEGKKALGTLGTRCISVEAAQALKDGGSYAQAELQGALHGLLTGPTTCLDLVQFVVKAGADINGQSDYGNTALILAAIWGHTDAAKWLLDNGADVRLKNKDGQTAADAAGSNAMRKLVKAASR